jgi:non-ribosomal peptide synthetase component F
LIAGLKALAIRQEATLFMLLLAAYFVLVCRYSGKVDLSIGTPVAGRTAPETEKLIGLFINTLVLRCDLSGNPAFIELVRQVRNTTLDALAHQDLPFSSLVRELNPRRLPGRSPFFRAFLNVKNIPAPTVSAPGLQFEPFDFDDHLIQNDLTLEVEFSPRRSSFAWKYATELYEPAAIECMAVHYRNILEAATRKPEIRLDQLLFLDKPGRG